MAIWIVRKKAWTCESVPRRDAFADLRKGTLMAEDKSFFYYGAVYHRLFDPQIEAARQRTMDLVPAGSSVLDIGCGTGQLCFALREQKQCRVVGVDLSLRMLEFARASNRFEDVTFVHEDATDLGSYEDRAFDYATMLMVIHELNRSQQALVLKESLRVANRLLVIDATSPLPKNPGGMGIRLVEATFGRDHFRNFQDYLTAGGIQGVLEVSGLPLQVEHSSVFWRGCREAVVVGSRA